MSRATTQRPANVAAITNVPATQSWGRVFVAEFKRTMLRTPSIVSLIVFALVTIGLAVGVTAVTTLAAQANSDAAVGPTFAGLELPLSLISFLLGLRCVSSCARDYTDGAAAATIVVVPNRTRLLTTRIVVWMLTTFVVTMVTMTAIVLIHATMIKDLVTVLTQALCASIGTCMLVLVAFACATLVRRGALAMLTFLAIDLLIPSALGIGAGFAPGVAGELIGYVNQVMPGHVVSTFTDMGMSAMGDSNEWIVSVVALVAWAVVALVVSHVSFARYSGASE